MTIKDSKNKLVKSGNSVLLVNTIYTIYQKQPKIRQKAAFLAVFSKKYLHIQNAQEHSCGKCEGQVKGFFDFFEKNKISKRKKGFFDAWQPKKEMLLYKGDNLTMADLCPFCAIVAYQFTKNWKEDTHEDTLDKTRGGSSCPVYAGRSRRRKHFCRIWCNGGLLLWAFGVLDCWILRKLSGRLH